MIITIFEERTLWNIYIKYSISIKKILSSHKMHTKHIHTLKQKAQIHPCSNFKTHIILVDIGDEREQRNTHIHTYKHHLWISLSPSRYKLHWSPIPVVGCWCHMAVDAICRQLLFLCICPDPHVLSGQKPVTTEERVVHTLVVEP